MDPPGWMGSDEVDMWRTWALRHEQREMEDARAEVGGAMLV